MKDYVDKHIEWRKRVNKNLPELASRVFALRGTGYCGCGFHYDLEKQLGNVIKGVNLYNDPIAFEHMTMMLLEIITTDLYKQVAKIEKEVKNRK